MKTNFKVSIIEPVGGHGGMDYYDFGLAGGLADAGIDVVLHTCEETDISGCPFEVHHTFGGIFGKDASWKRGLRYVRGTFAALLAAVFERRRIVHFHYFHIGPLQMMQILLARLLMRKIVSTAHDVESFVQGLEVPVMSRWTYRLSHLVIAHNQVSKNELIERIGLRPEQIAVIPHGNYLHTNRSLPISVDARHVLDIPMNAKVLLFFGQIKDAKGLDLLIEAMPEVLKSHPETMLLIAGRPWKSDFSVYEKLIDRVGIRNHCITHIRFIRDDEVPLYYRACDLVVLPYRRIYQSGVVLMAMSYGKAVLVSDLPGMTEIVTHGENGFVFCQGSDKDLALKINEALGDDQLCERAARRGLKYVRNNHDWVQIGRMTASLYGNIA